MTNPVYIEDHYIAILRNPYGHSDDTVRDARLKLADAYEKAMKELTKLRKELTRLKAPMEPYAFSYRVSGKEVLTHQPPDRVIEADCVLEATLYTEPPAFLTAEAEARGRKEARASIFTIPAFLRNKDNLDDELKELFGKPYAYICPVGCGCLWRDNGDNTMSLFNGSQVSCKHEGGCEWMPISKLLPLWANKE